MTWGERLAVLLLGVSMIAWADLSPAEQAALARARGPAEWSKYLHPDRSIPAHVKYLSDVVAREVRRGIATDDGAIICVSMPPGHIKSDTCSVNLPEWFLENWPDRHVAVSSYGADKASEWGRKIRDEIDENPDQFTIRLAPDSTSRSRFHTTAGGSLKTVGRGGGLTGFRAHLLIADDLLKDRKEADSETIRKDCWEWFVSVAYTRCWPSAVIVVVMTRWHEEDIIGRLERLKKKVESEGGTADEESIARKRIEVIRFPCIAEGADILGRKEGEALWPGGGYTERWAEQTRHFVGSREWAGLYQQRPAPAGGAVFKRDYFRYYRRDGEYVVLLHKERGPERVHISRFRFRQFADTAMTAKTSSDYTVVTTLAIRRSDGLVLVWDLDRARLEIPDQWDFIMRARSKYVRRGEYQWIGCEDKGSGIALLQLAKRYKVPMRELAAVLDKETRASDAATYYEQIKVFHPEDAEWLADFEHELLAFPTGSHDDQVDTLAYGVRSVTTPTKKKRKPKAERRDPWRTKNPLAGYEPAGDTR